MAISFFKNLRNHIMKEIGINMQGPLLFIFFGL